MTHWFNFLLNKAINLVVLVLIFLVVACSENEQNKAIMSMFSEVNPEKSGLQFSNDLSYKENLNIIDYLYYYNGGGVAVGDLNNDGLDDIYFTANQLPDKLYLNKGNLTFEDITKTSGIEIDSTWSTGVSFEDLNNDGFLDIYVSKVGVFREDAHNKVYINQGKLDDNKNVSFIEVSQEIGLNFNGFSTQTAFLDYDNDGDMDIYLLNHAVHTTRSYGGIEKRYEKDSLSGDVFYENKLNEGQFYFEDVTEKVGIYSSSLGYGLGINASDINGDGLTDIYISNDFHENDYLYINNGPKGENKQVTFTESSEKYFTHTSRFSMGMDIGDLNDDNLPDIFTLDMMPYDNEIFLKSGGEDTDKVTQIKNDFGYQTQYARNAMQINTGNGEFSDRALMAKAHATDWSWSALIQDFDNDGLNDVYITNGIYKRPNDLDYINYLSSTDFAKYTNENQKKLEQKLIAQMPTIKLPNVLLKNNGDHSFENISKEIGLTTSYSNGAAYSDFDNDGDIDIIINNINSNATLLENKTQQNQTENYIQFSLDKNNTESVTTGSKVRVFSNGTYREKQLSPSRGFQSASTRTLHFGLGSQKIIDSAQIIWPNGKIQTEKKVVLNTKNSVSQKTDLSTFKTSIISTDISVTEFPYIHFENDYLDYGREPLMPEKLSTEGPALVYEDLTGDGIKDLFIGGSRYHKSSFYKGLASNDFEKIAVSTFEMDEKYEDVNAVAFDLENDGDLDLYVQSGGNDKQEGDPLLEDRMYINQGNGKFERVTAQLPATNGGSLAAGDYNNDGFKDLFVGSRSVPGAYGMSPVSLILKNNTKGGFTAVAQDKMGMVTDSKWADLNNDGFKDLIVIGDWMPITILMNQKNGKFKYATPALGLSKTSGLWNTIEVTDIDGNGSLDILAGNVGENFKWQATTEKPVKLYIDDFDENGQLDPIIFYPLFGNDVPFANRTTLNAQLPYLAKKYKNYNEFSKIKGIEDITDKAVKDINVKKELHELRSMVYLNSGDSLVGHPLPKSAQASTIQDFVVSGKSVAYVGNYKGFVTELGNNDGNAGGILANFDKNTYKKSTNLPLPIGLEAKHIINLSSATYLVISNNNRAYVLK